MHVEEDKMSLRPVILLGILVSFAPWTRVGAFQCFNCSSDEKPECGDPFDQRLVKSIDCKTSCFKKVSRSTVIRGCSRTAAYTFSNEFKCVADTAEMECICNEMDCNRASRHILASNCWVVLVSSALIIHHFW